MWSNMFSFIFYFQLINPVHKHMIAEHGIMIEEYLWGMGMQNAHFSMVFWSKVIHPADVAVLSSLKVHSFCLLQFFLLYCNHKCTKLIGLELTINYSPFECCRLVAVEKVRPGRWGCHWPHPSKFCIIYNWEK